MGRTLALYALSMSDHDKDKPICMNWEYQREYNERVYEVSEFLNLDESCYHKNEPYKYVSSKRIINPDWCPKCALFTEGITSSNPLVKSSLSFNHSYSNNIWRSKWHFFNMYLGDPHTDFCNKFINNNDGYRQIYMSDDIYSYKNINNLHKHLEDLGKPYCTVDKEAYDETMSFIHFCKEWLQKPDIIVIYDSEV